MYTKTYETRYGDYKDYETIKPSTVMDLVQDVSVAHSATCGYGLYDLRDMQLAWFLHGIKVHFDKPISTKTPVTVFTAVKAMRGMISQRGCRLLQNGEVVAKTIADWFLFDVAAGKPCRMPKEMLTAYPPFDFDGDEFYHYTKPALQSPPIAYSVRISNKEIDTNKHLNNQKSAELLMDALPFEFAFTDMNVLYKQAAYWGDELDVCVAEIENGYYVHLQTKAGDVCVAGTFETGDAL